MAVGADRRDILGMILREAAGLLGVGLVAGTLVALLIGHAASALLFGLEPHDPATLLGAAVSLAAVAALASYVPAARAARLDPTSALRD
jgi:ABC-type antimicrobial peptide transport system permease subunit